MERPGAPALWAPEQIKEIRSASYLRHATSRASCALFDPSATLGYSRKHRFSKSLRVTNPY